jgi:hypothetical protein
VGSTSVTHSHAQAASAGTCQAQPPLPQHLLWMGLAAVEAAASACRCAACWVRQVAEDMADPQG